MEVINFKDIINQENKINNIISKLLKDKTTGKNIVWATDTYEVFGQEYRKECQMTAYQTIKLIRDGVMLPRIMKTKEQQNKRTKGKAEVYTPSWICNKMNNYCDEQWFNRKNVFNYEKDNNTWITNENRIEFEKKKTWKKYVDSRRIEITCGEAPYIVSRYDATTGEKLDINDRIGILDRKLRVVNENTDKEEEWLKWTYRAYESVYGYEFQGDSLFFARINLVQTFVDYYNDRFKKDPNQVILNKIVNIVSWNLWQMDGFKDTVPFEFSEMDYEQISFNDLLYEKESERKIEFCKIKDWRANRTLEYRKLKGEQKNEI